MKAILKNGVILPREPFPVDWTEGMELQVEKIDHDVTKSNNELDRWMAAVQEAADEMDAEDEIILENSIREIRSQARKIAQSDAG